MQGAKRGQNLRLAEGEASRLAVPKALGVAEAARRAWSVQRCCRRHSVAAAVPGVVVQRLVHPLEQGAMVIRLFWQVEGYRR